MFIWDFILGDVMNQFIKWVYGQVVGFLAAFFALMLSFMTLYPKGWQQHSFVALCGVGGQAMLKLLELHPQIPRPVLCLDNDEAGQKATARLTAALGEKGYSTSVLLPQGKDWNEDVLAAERRTVQPAQMKMA